LLISLDTSNYFIEADTSNNRYLSEKPIVPGVMTGPAGSVPVYSPAEITEPGYYVLKRDIDGGTKNNIFTIKTSGVTFDGGGNTIRGTPNGFTTAVYVDGGVALHDITIKNLTVEGIDTGVWLFKADNGKITGCTFRNMKNLGLRLDQSHQNEISGNTFDQNNMGIGIFQSNGNIIYNNYLQNQFNAVVNDDQKNQWSINLTSGTNILGGDLIGGNAWFDIAGGGFSATAQDLKTPGISDTPYSLNPNNLDLYPLKAPGISPNPTTIPLAEIPEVTVMPEEPVSVTGNVENPNETLSQAAEPEPTPVSTPDTALSEIPEEQNVNITSNENPDSRYADISVKQVLVPESTCPGSDLNFSVVFENPGAYNADSFQVRYYLSEDKQADAQDIPLGEETIQNLPAGGELTKNETCTIPASIGLKNYFIVVVANTGNDVFEDKKDNNNGYSPERVEIRSC
ncbi:MAG: right-handed parallel beta-helix repeat-containing protein, partial [Methanospirillum sp.]|nr:right-handed parallel beta-helix repeat-containing protein [Methanospirillum sp.]